MKVMLISTTIFQLTKSGLTGYGGLEHIVALLAIELKKLGCEVSVVCPEGSDLGEGIEIIPVPLRCGEDVAYERYKGRLTSGEFDAVEDHSWSWMSVLSQMESDHQLPIIHCYHSDPYNLQTPPPIRYPCLVAFSEAQANIIRSRWSACVQVVKHGIDLNFYKPDPTVKRGDRYLFLARYCPEKGFLEVSYLAKKCKVGLDAFGDTEIVGPHQDYMRKCFEESDGRQIRVNPGISREQTVKEYQSHKALITWPNFVEIWGLSTTEALACGCPVISKDSGAAREQILQGRTGWVVSTLEQAEELITSGKIDTIKSEACVKRASKFSIQASTRGHLKLLTEVAQGFVW